MSTGVTYPNCTRSARNQSWILVQWFTNGLELASGRPNMPKFGQKQQHKKVARNKHNRNWQGIRHNDVEAVKQVLGENEGGIKQKTLEALRLLRQADHALDKICKYLADRTENVWNCRTTNTSGIAKVKLEMSSGKLTRKKDGCLSQLSLSYIWVRRVSWAVSRLFRICVQRTRYESTIIYAKRQFVYCHWDTMEDILLGIKIFY